MNREIGTEWLADLRDGTRIQGRRCLRVVEAGVIKQCCLDVLCEQAVRKGVIPAPVLSEFGRYFYDDGVHQEGFALPAAVSEWAGLDECDATVEIVQYGHAFESSLSGLNDSHGYSFSEIADVIEAQLL